MIDSQGNFVGKAKDIYKEGQNTINKNTGRPFFEKPKDLLDWANQYRLREKAGPTETNLEKARELKYPSFFYTYGPEATMDAIGRQIPEIARLETFGQKLHGSDLFDKTAAKISGDLSL